MKPGVSFELHHLLFKCQDQAFCCFEMISCFLAIAEIRRTRRIRKSDVIELGIRKGHCKEKEKHCGFDTFVLLEKTNPLYGVYTAYRGMFPSNNKLRNLYSNPDILLTFTPFNINKKKDESKSKCNPPLQS